MDPIEAVLAYHERTKHQPRRFAPSLGFMDWPNQPKPFRRYDGARIESLDEVTPQDAPTLDEVADGEVAPTRSLDRSFVSQLFYDSLALSAWKVAGAGRWSLRCNPSSGNLHPTEGYLLVGPVKELTDGPALWHYAPHEHALECRRSIDPELWRQLTHELPGEPVLVGLSSIHWRESWKYGERAYRYCQHDAGHAIAAIAYAAAALGWRCRLLHGVGDEALDSILGLADQQGPEAEHGDCLLLLHRPDDIAPSCWEPVGAAVEALRSAALVGTPNRLSAHHHPWPSIDEVAAAARAAGMLLPNVETIIEQPAPDEPPPRPVSARRVIRQRRSAVAMDGTTTMAADCFYRIVSRLLPAPGCTPFAAIPWPPAIHPVFFVHRIDGVEPGLYLLPRRDDIADTLRSAMRDDFAWAHPDDCPPGLNLFRLVADDVRRLARVVSCDQEIASHGVFAVAMLAEFEPALRRYGAPFYRCLHWEAGAIGQLLYLEAEAAEIRGTGIGCFFDDLVHEILGLDDRRFQTVYHFTVGGPVEDPRLRTEAAYGHLTERAGV